MKEVLTRRFRKKDRLPSLILIDGGKGQVTAALEVLRSNNLDIPIVGLVKPEDELIIPYHHKDMKIQFLHRRIGKGSPGLRLLQRIRDEAHRFAKRYHTHLRSKSTIDD